MIQLFANPTVAQALCLFLMNPREEFYQARIVKETGKALIQVQRSLKPLERSGLISSEHRGRHTYYKANCSHPAFEDLKRAFLKTIGIGDLLRNALYAEDKKIALAWIFGSVAAGEEKSESDVDLILVSDLDLEEMSEVIGPVSRAMRRELNAVFLTPKELYKKHMEKDYFVSDLVKSPKIWLVGNDSELERLLKGATFKATTSLKK